jgi:hypothetical protein
VFAASPQFRIIILKACIHHPITSSSLFTRKNRCRSLPIPTGRIQNRWGQPCAWRLPESTVSARLVHCLLQDKWKYHNPMHNPKHHEPKSNRITHVINERRMKTIIVLQPPALFSVEARYRSALEVCLAADSSSSQMLSCWTRNNGKHPR